VYDFFTLYPYFALQNIVVLKYIYEFESFADIRESLKNFFESMIKYDTYWLCILTQCIGYLIYSMLWGEDLEFAGYAALIQVGLNTAAVVFRCVVQISFIRRLFLIAFIGTQIFLINPLGKFFPSYSIYTALFILYQVLKSIIFIRDNFMVSGMNITVSKSNRAKIITCMALEVIVFYLGYQNDVQDYPRISGWFSYKTLIYALVACSFIMGELIMIPFLINRIPLNFILLMSFAVAESFIMCFIVNMSNTDDVVFTFFPLAMIT